MATKFIRVRGRVIPIRGKQDTKRKVAGTAAGVAAGLGAATLSKASAGVLKGASTVLAGASGAIAGIPLGKGLRGFALSQGVSFGLDVASVAANASHAAKLTGTRGQKAKAFAKHEAFNIGVGYAALGGTLLGTCSGRKQLLGGINSAKRFIKRRMA